VDPIDDLSFCGEYEETDPEESEEEQSSEEESGRKKKPKRKVERLIMNVSDTKYPVVKFVGKKIFKMALQNETDGVNWDLFWTDNAVQPEQLGRM
jgi:tubulin polyglutamylase TTLL6/13